MTKGFRKSPIRNLILLLCVFWPQLIGAVSVTVVNPPATMFPGQNYTVNVSYARTPTDTERRVVFFLQMHRASDAGLLVKLVQDNGNAGYTEQTGSIPFQIAAPAGTSGQVYFVAWAVPWSMNRAVVQQYKTYPTNGTFTYLWGGGGFGVTQNVYYRSALICPKPSGNTTYCSGLAFEANIVAYNNYNTLYGHSTIGGMTSAQMETFRRVWYGVTDAEKLAARAIPEYGLGLQITNLEEVQEGDAIQFWRWSGSGHNPTFVNWVRNGSGQITGLRYWGSQPSSNGIGYSTESFGTSSGINLARFYAGRMRKPRDQADYAWALGTFSTATAPTTVSGLTSAEDWQLYE